MSAENENSATYPVVERCTWPAIRRATQRWPSGRIGWNPGQASPVHWLEARQRYFLGSGARNFNGADQWFSLASNPEVAATGDLWVSCWFHKTTTDPNGHALVSKYDAGHEYSLWINSSDFVRWNVGPSANIASLFPVATNQWYHVVGIIDRVRGLLRMFLNGADQNPVDADPIVTNDGDVTVGFGLLNLFLTGDLCQLAIGRPTVPISEIERDLVELLYQNGNGLHLADMDPATAELLGCTNTRWPLDERTGDALPVAGPYTLADNGGVEQAVGPQHGFAINQNAKNQFPGLVKAIGSNPHPEAALGYDQAGAWQSKWNGRLAGNTPANERWTFDSPNGSYDGDVPSGAPGGNDWRMSRIADVDRATVADHPDGTVNRLVRDSVGEIHSTILGTYSSSPRSDDVMAGVAGRSLDCDGNLWTASGFENLDALAVGAGSFSYGFRFKTSEDFSSGSRLIVVKGSSRFYRAFIESTNSIFAQISDGANQAVVNASGTQNNGAWHSALVTVNRADETMRIYIDGAISGIQASTAAVGDLDEPGAPIAHGGSYTGQQLFRGLLDDCTVWPTKALDDVEAAAWHSGQLVPGASYVASFDEADTLAADGDRSIVFDQAGPGHVIGDQVAGPRPTGTIEAWYKNDADQTAHDHSCVYNPGDTGFTGLVLFGRRESDQANWVQWGTGSSTQAHVGRVYPTGEWVHAVFTWNQAENRTRYYLNGSLYRERSGQDPPVIEYNPQGQIGASSEGATRFGNGPVALVRDSVEEYTPDQVAHLYETGNPAHVPQQQWITHQAPRTVVAGDVALDHRNLDELVVDNVVLPRQITFTLWHKDTQAEGSSPTLFQYREGSDNDGYFMGVRPESNPYLYMNPNGTLEFDQLETRQGVWTHTAWCVDLDAKTVKCRTNGQSQTVGYASEMLGTPATLQHSGRLSGFHAGGPSQALRIYHRILSDAEIDADKAGNLQTGDLMRWPLTDGADHDADLVASGDVSMARTWENAAERWHLTGDGASRLATIRSGSFFAKNQSATLMIRQKHTGSDPVYSYGEAGSNDNIVFWIGGNSTRIDVKIRDTNLVANDLNMPVSGFNTEDGYWLGVQVTPERYLRGFFNGVFQQAVSDNNLRESLAANPLLTAAILGVPRLSTVYGLADVLELVLIPRLVDEAEQLEVIAGNLPPDAIRYPCAEQPDRTGTLEPQADQDTHWTTRAPTGQEWAWYGDGSNRHISAEQIIPPEALSIRAKFIVTPSDVSDYMPFVSWDSGANNTGLFLNFFNQSRYMLSMASNNFCYFDWDVDPTDGNEHTLLVTLPGAAQIDILSAEMFVDGLQMNKSANQSGPQVARGPLWIGKSFNQIMAGVVAHVEIFDQVIAWGDTTTKPLATYRLDEGASGNAVIDGGPINRWRDRSGSGNDVFSPSGFGRPTWDQAKRYVRFDGVDDGLVSLLAVALAARGELTIFAVYERDSASSPNANYIVEQSVDYATNDGFVISNDGGGQVTGAVSGALVAGPAASWDRLLTCSARYSPAAGLEVYENGASLGVGPSAAGLTDDLLFIAARNISSRVLLGGIREIVTYDYRFDDEEMAEANEYFVTKHPPG